MKWTAILFDLDGTLLPMDQEEFTKGYFKALTKHLAPFGYEPETLIKAVWDGTGAMVMNDGSRPNEEAFWDKFSEHYGEKGRADKKLFDEFYANSFCEAKDTCGFNPLVPEALRKIAAMGYRVIIATNPIFPETANKQRLSWAGLDPDSFEYITSYENSTYSKPNPLYYTEIANKLSLDPAECLMVGNDVSEDMSAQEAGMSVFLLTDCMINKKNADVTVYKHGGFPELLQYIETL